MIPLKTIEPQLLQEHDCGLLFNRRILIADDSPAIRFIAAATLRRHGADVVEVANGKDAIQHASPNDFDLILLDVQMPGVDGLEASRALRTTGVVKTPIIALTASLQSEYGACFAAGMDDILSKPFTQSSLVDLVLCHLGADQNDGQYSRGMSESEPLFSIKSLHTLCSGNMVFMQRTLGIAVQELPFAAEQMRSAYSSGQLEYLRKVVHRVRPCIEGLQITSLAGKLLQIESLIAEDNSDNDSLGIMTSAAADDLEAIARQIIKRY